FLKTPGIFGLPGSLRYTPLPNAGRDKSLAGLKMRQMDRDLRIKVRDQILDRFNEVLIQLGVKGFLWGRAVREIADLIIKPKLNKFLDL
ncbi:MAG: hypothetical protein WCR20_23465, partial [Verrucomicrobiota bacterium]